MKLQTKYQEQSRIITQDKFIIVGGKRFHYIWLRENCPSCRYTAPLQQLYDPKISDRPENPQPLSVELNEENLIIDWDETPPHRSTFSLGWLVENAYDPQPKLESDAYFLWDQKRLKLQSPTTFDVNKINDDAWMDQLFSLGFVVLENIPPDGLESFLSSIGPIYNVDYGKIFTLQSGVMNKDSNPRRDGCALPVHNDLSYWGGHHLAQFLYCIENDTKGGESTLVDGFRVAQDFRQDYPDYFQKLVETPVQFWLIDHEHHYHFCKTASILECDNTGKLNTVRFSHRNCRPHLPFEQLEYYYQAYNSFYSYLKNPDYQYQFRLNPHNCILFQNFRILHGRTAFNPDTGTRKLNSGYLDWNFFVGRRNFKNQKF